MSKPFDASPKALLEFGPADWSAFVGIRAKAVEIVDADVSTVTAAADKVLLVHASDGDRILHFDFQSGPDVTVPRRLHSYNALLEVRHELPVQSVVVLLASKANLRAINGKYDRLLPGESHPYLRFVYRVIRVWELPVEGVLSSGPNVLPLAPISKVAPDQLPEVIEQMEERFTSLCDPSTVGELWTATSVLLGLRYDKTFAEQLLRGVRAMKESVTYQAIVEEGIQKGLQKGLKEGLEKGLLEGRIQEARRLLLRVGKERFDTPPSPAQAMELEAINDVGHLEELAVRALRVSDWAELLASRPKPRPSRRKKS